MGVEQGRVVEVSIEPAGDEAVQDHAAGATVLYVKDTSDFDEEGKLSIAGVIYDYSAKDEDLNTITLSAPLTTSVAEDTEIFLSPYTQEKWATVSIEEGEDSVSARIPMYLADGVADGVRDEDEQEACLVELVGTEWVVRDIIGSDGEDDIKWEQDDFYLLTAADITAGTATFRISHQPKNEALTLVLAGVPQPPTEWSIDYSARTITTPLSGWEEAGNLVWVHYAYKKGIDVVAPDPVLVGVTELEGPASSIALPAGTLSGDLLILAHATWNAATVSDARMASEDSFAGHYVALGKVWIGRATSSTAPINYSVSSGNGESAVLIALRGGEILGKGAPASLVAPTSNPTSVAAPVVLDSGYTIAVAMYRTEGFTTGYISKTGSGFSELGYVNGGSKTGVWIGLSDPETPGVSPADVFNFGGQIDGIGVNTYKIGGAV